MLLDANPFSPKWTLTMAGEPQLELQLSDAFDDISALVAERNFDFYRYEEGQIRAIR